ncbi:response regulator [bacterium]|nr:response regulator [bacterium]MBU1065693.1 response regulator [bacterium]MBU1635563.1 response regulator [bacterium]MBU1874245.1 response regulator [bacterium]
MNKNRILIVDDEPNVCQFLSEYLEYKGFETQISQSGKEALKYLETDTFDAILLDLIMPEMNGLEVLEKIRQMKIMIPVIIVTGVKDKNVADDAIKLGAADFIPKPIDLDRLEQSLIVNIKNLQ